MTVPAYIGSYRIDGELGRGGMGEVLLGYDQRLRRPVAIKRIRGDRTLTPERRERLRREARAAAQLSHPAITQVYDIVLGDSSDSIVMEVLDGQTVAALLRQKPLELSRSLAIARQVAEGLEVAHRQGVVHRDLKAENVMVTTAGQAKILDFGLARSHRDEGETALTREGATLGTSRAMSPEQAGGGAVDARSDLFSLGVLLYEMVARRSPFAGDNELQSLKKVLTEDPPPLDQVSPGTPEPLAGLVVRLLAKEPQQRPESAGAVARELLSIERELDADVSRDAPAYPAPSTATFDSEVLSPHRGSQQGRRRRTRLLLRIGMALAVAGAAIGAWLTISPAPEPAIVALEAPWVEAEGLDEKVARVVAFTVFEAAAGALSASSRVLLLEPPQPGALPESAMARARAEEADEVARPRLDCDRAACQVSLHFVDPDSGTLLRGIGPFSVPADADAVHATALAVRAHIGRVLPGSTSNERGRLDDVLPADYARYIALRTRVENGESLGAEELQELRSVVRSSPDLIDAYLLGIGIARTMGDFDQALEWAEDGTRLDPEDPRPLFERLRVELAAGRVNAAEKTLKRLEEVAPADVRVQAGRAEVLARSGETVEATALYRRIVERRPTWRYLLALANLELAGGGSAAARARLEQILDDDARNTWALAKLAELEVQYGSLARARDLFQQLLAIRPRRSSFVNLGWIAFLEGDYPAAEAAYRGALELDPKHLTSRLNRATALEAAGQLGEARRLFAAIFEELEPELSFSPADPVRQLYAAQCLARLGRTDDAYELAERVLEEPPTEVRVLYQAAQVYALVGAPIPARHYAREALKQGLRREWFAIPAFRSLADDGELQSLLEHYAPSPQP